MPIGVLGPLVVFFAMGVIVVYLLWRVMVVGAELRRNAQQGRATADLAHRADISLGELCVIVDDMRRRKSAPETGAPSLRAAADGLGLYAQEAQAIARMGSSQETGTSLVADLERARRAVDLIEHGRQLMLERAVDHIGEGETEVKRGYLNLVHAREAIRARGEEIAREARGEASG